MPYQCCSRRIRVAQRNPRRSVTTGHVQRESRFEGLQLSEEKERIRGQCAYENGHGQKEQKARSQVEEGPSC
jgi:hypothetical protein